MALRDNMLRVVQDHGAPVCDDCVWRPAGMTSRQQANSRGRELEAGGYLRRGKGTCADCGKYKTVSVSTGASLPEVVEHHSDTKPWHWEGNVQDGLAGHLASKGWTIVSTADTAAKTPGVDIVAVDPEGLDWWITVKGYPEDRPTKKTRAATQAPHWFSAAMFDVVTYRTKREDVRIGVALPGPFATYQGLLKKSAWLRNAAPYTLFIVREDGSIEVGSPPE